MNVRKIIQLIDVQDTKYSQGYITALCDDGTVWFYQGDKWDLLQEKIPQDKIDT